MHDYGGRTSTLGGVATARALPSWWRRFRPARLPVAVLVGVGLCSATALGESSLRSQLSAMVQSASDLIAQRSPGIRTRAIMGKGKMKGERPVRFARALPRVRDARGIEAPPMATGAAALPDALAALPAEAVPAAAPVGGVIPGTGSGPGGGGGFLFAPLPFPGLGGPGGGGVVIVRPGGEQPSPPLVPPPAPAVPEPATWAMMLFGFGALGYTLRRKSHGRSIAA